jgi:predicted ATPase
MGKTRLSLEAAGQMIQTFSQGLYFVALDRITSADMIVQATAEVLPIFLASNEDPKSRVVDYLRDKKILLVMDNFEHVLDGATFVQDILGAAPHVHVLATSRVKLNLTSETVFTIEGLTVDGGCPEKTSAIQLFAESARRIHSKFKLNDATLPAVTRICRMIDGMPLAIVLAARVERSGDTFEQVWALEWRAYALILLHQIDKAVQTLQQSLALSKGLDNPMVWSWSEAQLGVCAMALGDTSDTKTYYLRGAQQAEEIHYGRMLQICYETLGTLALIEKDLEQAQQFSLKCLHISQECGQTREMLASLRDLASVYIAQGKLDRALQFLAVVLNHPASEQNSLNRPEPIRDEAEKLRAQIESQLDRSLYQSAWEAGKKGSLAEVVARILN